MSFPAAESTDALVAVRFVVPPWVFRTGATGAVLAAAFAGAFAFACLPIALQWWRIAWERSHTHKHNVHTARAVPLGNRAYFGSY